MGMEPAVLPPTSHQVAPLEGVADVFFVVEDRAYKKDVRQVRGRTLHHVRVVEGYDVTVSEFLDIVGRVLQDRIHGATELAHDHASFAVGDQGELVGLLPDDGAYGGRYQHPVHLVPDVL